MRTMVVSWENDEMLDKAAGNQACDRSAVRRGPGGGRDGHSPGTMRVGQSLGDRGGST